MMNRILIIEDNIDLAEGLSNNLKIEGFLVRMCHDGDQAMSNIESFQPHLIVLDMMLPYKDGFEIIDELKKKQIGVLVLCLTARNEEVDKVRALRSGADDYLTKPFGLMEFLARVEALLRRSYNNRNQDVIGAIKINQDLKQVRKHGKVIDLTPMEYKLLIYLFSNKNQVKSRQQIMKCVWGHQAAINSRTVDTHIAELRKKLEIKPHKPKFILTVSKFGYKIITHKEE